MIACDITKNGEVLAGAESTGVYVHEEDEAAHKAVVPTGSMYYRVWTPSNDFESLFLTVFAISESEQTIVE